MGLRPHPPHRSPTPGDTVTFSPPRTLRLACDASAPAPAEVSRARGRPALANRRLAPSARKRVVELRPDPIRSDTSCHKTAPALGGDPSTAGRPAAAERQSVAIPPRKPNLVSKHEAVGLRGLRTVCFRETAGLNKHCTTCLRGIVQTCPEAPACLRNPMPGQGRLSRISAKRSEIRRAQGAFHR